MAGGKDSAPTFNAISLDTNGTHSNGASLPLPESAAEGWAQMQRPVVARSRQGTNVSRARSRASTIRTQQSDAASDISDSSAVTVAVPTWGSLRNSIRALVVGNEWFERFWLLVIFVNCVVLALEDPKDKNCLYSRCKFTNYADYVLTNLFVVEMVVKLIGLGVWERHDAYFRDGWNTLDAFIVVVGFLAFVLEVVFSIEGPVLSGLRAFRLLRPLKAVHAFPALQLLILAIVGSLPQLLNVMLLYTTFLIVMGIVAVELWKGKLGYHCATFDNATGTFGEAGERTCVFQPNGTEPEYSTFGGHLCEFGTVCIEDGLNPYNGRLSFDNIGLAALTLYVALTLEGWTETMYQTMDAGSLVNSLFWVVLILLGSFFILNLTIVIITEAFEGKQRDIREELFHKIDKDGGGDLDKEEVRQLLGRLGYEFGSEEALSKVFDEMDLDGGGTVSLDEFLVYCQENSAAIGRAISKKGGVKSFFDDFKKWWGGKRDMALDQIKNTLEDDKPSWLRTLLYDMVSDPETSGRPRLAKYFAVMVIVTIILNTIALALEGHDTPPELEDRLHVVDMGFTFVFTIEMVAKIIGLGVYGYFIDNPSNNFDCVLVVTSLIGMFGVGSNVSALRSFRVLRVVRLTKSIPLLSRWLNIMISSMKAASILTVLIFLMVFIVALLGMQLFGGNFCDLDDEAGPSTDTRAGIPPCNGLPRSNYDTVTSSLLTSFQILTGEDWNVVMYNGMRASSDWVAIYFVAYYTLGNYMMLNLFIAVLLSNRDLKAETDQMVEERMEANESKARLKVTQGAMSQSLLHSDMLERRRSDVNAVVKKSYSTLLIPLRPYMDRDNSLFIIPADSPLRLSLVKVVESSAFETLVLLAICVSTGALAVENPLLPEDHPTAQLLHSINFYMLIVFVLEAFFKAVVMGFVLHPSSYLRSSMWNVLDFAIVCISLMSFLPGGSQLGMLKLLRTLRPLRFINKSEGMRVVMASLVQSIKPLLNVAFISGMIWLIFAIIGVQMFSGKFYRCTLDGYGDMDASFTLKTDCLNATLCPPTDPATGVRPDGPCRWTTYSSHFDNVGAAFLTLFEMASLEGWVTVMELGMDAVSHEHAPVQDYNGWAAYYFVIFIVFGSCFLMNLFIGVLIDTYYAEKEKLAAQGSSGGGRYLTSEQKKWVEQHRVMLNFLQGSSDEETEFEMRFGLERNPSLLNRIVQSEQLDYFIVSCVCINVLLMTLNHYPEADWLQYVSVADFIFVTIFTLEAIAKVLNFGFKWYFKDSWNRFDFAIVIVSLIGLVVELVVSGGAVVSAFRVIRLARLFRMAKWADGIQKILKTLFLALPSMINVAGIVGLMFFMYAVLGVKLFAKLDRDSDNNDLGPHVHFETFYIAILLLFRITTGEAWQSIMDAARVEPPDCDPHLDNCGDSFAAVLYFCTFTLAGMYVLLNLFIAVIVDSFSEAGSTHQCTPAYLEHMQECWKRRVTVSPVVRKCPDLRLDLPPGIPEGELEDFLRNIGPPLGFPKFMPSSRRQEFLEAVNIRAHPLTGLVSEMEVFPKLMHHVFGKDLPEGVREQLQEAEERVADPALTARCFKQSRAVILIQKAMRARLARIRVERRRQEIDEMKSATPYGAPLKSPPQPPPLFSFGAAPTDAANPPTQPAAAPPKPTGSCAQPPRRISVPPVPDPPPSAQPPATTPPERMSLLDSMRRASRQGLPPGSPYGHAGPGSPYERSNNGDSLRRASGDTFSGLLHNPLSPSSPYRAFESSRTLGASGTFSPSGSARLDPLRHPLSSPKKTLVASGRNELFSPRPRRSIGSQPLMLSPTLTSSSLGSPTSRTTLGRLQNGSTSALHSTHGRSDAGSANTPLAVICGCDPSEQAKVSRIVRDKGFSAYFCESFANLHAVNPDVLIISTQGGAVSDVHALLSAYPPHDRPYTVGLHFGGAGMPSEMLNLFDKIGSPHTLGAVLAALGKTQGLNAEILL